MHDRDLLGGVALAGLLAVRSRVLPRMRLTAEDSHFIGPLVHSIMVFHGRDERGGLAPPGLYFVRAESGLQVLHARLLRVR